MTTDSPTAIRTNTSQHRDMMLAEQTKLTASLNAHYEELAFELNDGDKGNFLSGWQCENPFVSSFFATVKKRAESLDYTRYTYFDEHVALADSIVAMHAKFDRTPPQSVMCGSGTTSLLFAFVTHLQSIGTPRIYYIPPLYITLYSALDRYGIETIPVSTKQPFESKFTLHLPEERNSTLLLTDPIWYAGTSIAPAIIDEIREWQRRTSSLVFVDGSLQYLRWNGTINEATARLDPSLTFRLICPAKQLSSHGYRFSYILLPQSHNRRMTWVYTNIFGPACTDSIAFGHEAVTAISNQRIPQELMALASKRHAYLRENKIIESEVTPDCGYFVFEKIRVPLPEGYVKVDGKFFNQQNYPDHIKINLLSPSMKLISTFASEMGRP
jgi:hypothetical protein